MNELYSAGALLGLADSKPETIAVIGCGGKTTLIASLANEFKHKKVLVTPTAKMFPLQGKKIVHRTTLTGCLSHMPLKGIQCLGMLNETTGKLEAITQSELETMILQYDLVFLKADGSNGLPCKGWLANEPVIPLFCTHTIGVVTLNALGKPADSNMVLHLPEFLKLTGLCCGETITLKALSKMVCADYGMFHNGKGRQSIFVNQAEDNAAAVLAKEWLQGIEKLYSGRFACLAYGNARTNKWTALHAAGKG